jgi:DNA-binding NarL/FixJ family response regulator
MSENQKLEDVDLNDMYAEITPLEKAVGFHVAEETYDLLTFREQLIVDLLCAGYTHAQIGNVFDVSQPSISSSVRRLRFKLADGKLQLILETRQAFKAGELGSKF